MNLRLPRFLLALRAGSGEASGEIRETGSGAEARLEAGHGWLQVSVPAGDGPAQLISGAVDFLVFHRLADGTVHPIRLRPEVVLDIALVPGDALVCLTPRAEPFGAHRIAAFLHVHDTFNAPRLAERLLAEIEAGAGVACLVVEAR